MKVVHRLQIPEGPKIGYILFPQKEESGADVWFLWVFMFYMLLCQMKYDLLVFKHGILISLLIIKTLFRIAIYL